jgi:hypothetical protein
VKLIQSSKPTAIRAVDTLARLGILAETTGKKRDRTALCIVLIWNAFAQEESSTHHGESASSATNRAGLKTSF